MMKCPKHHWRTTNDIFKCFKKNTMKGPMKRKMKECDTREKKMKQRKQEKK